MGFSNACKPVQAREELGILRGEWSTARLLCAAACTVILEFVPAEPDNLKLRSRHCYDTEAAAILQTSGGVHL